MLRIISCAYKLNLVISGKFKLLPVYLNPLNFFFFFILPKPFHYFISFALFLDLYFVTIAAEELIQNNVNRNKEIVSKNTRTWLW